MEFVLKAWIDEYGDFLKEKTYNHDTKRWHYTHKLSQISSQEYIC